MNDSLYPLKFKPILKDKIWGGNRLQEILNKDTNTGECGESWELSGVEGDVSVISNGFLEGNNLEEIMEVYMGDLVGDKVFDKFGIAFPLLIKFIDANDDLSIQVHPDDEVAAEKHSSFGKTEMWYVMDAEKEAKLTIGFNQKMDKETYVQHVENKSLESILNKENIKKGDTYFIPAGRVHAIGAGTLLAEIQQTSDITYRIYDYERKDAAGNTRELHTKLAVDVIDYDYHSQLKSEYETVKNTPVNLVTCNYFCTNIIHLTAEVTRDYSELDSFVIYICTEGKITIMWNNESITLVKGETILIPAMLDFITISPEGVSAILEVYIK